MTIKRDFQLTEYCNEIAADIARDASDHEQATDWAHESADGSEHVIYTYKAHQVCQNCDIQQGEEFFADCYDDTHGKSYDEIASIMAYGEIRARIEARLYEIFEEREAA
mgnify:CR=1 FL=1